MTVRPTEERAKLLSFLSSIWIFIKVNKQVSRNSPALTFDPTGLSALNTLQAFSRFTHLGALLVTGCHWICRSGLKLLIAIANCFEYPKQSYTSPSPAPWDALRRNFSPSTAEVGVRRQTPPQVLCGAHGKGELVSRDLLVFSLLSLTCSLYWTHSFWLPKLEPKIKSILLKLHPPVSLSFFSCPVVMLKGFDQSSFKGRGFILAHTSRSPSGCGSQGSRTLKQLVMLNL